MEERFDINAFMDPEKPYNLNERIKLFILEIFDFVESLPKTPAGRNINSQLVRCSSSVGANYRAAKRGRSDKNIFLNLGYVKKKQTKLAFG